MSSYVVLGNFLGFYYHFSQITNIDLTNKQKYDTFKKNTYFSTVWIFWRCFKFKVM